jgi:hypothetical protein
MDAVGLAKVWMEAADLMLGRVAREVVHEQGGGLHAVTAATLRHLADMDAAGLAKS